ncbi:MAG TPA: helix-turn-helix transcriptional regulator [Stellaceae bacterium]|nr:helix-turn-helix transcriptional regulator [Stellaceae bacterium]
MNRNELPFGVLVRRWRLHRRMTQMDFAAAASTSTRHLSYLETGRAQPSREMVMRLAQCLEIPLRERNALLLSAGYAPGFTERPLGELTAARRAIEQILEAHKPYPAFAIDRHWNIVLSNRAIPQIYVDVAPELMRPPVNAIRLTLHPRGMAPRIVNFAEWRQHVIAELKRHIDARPDPGTEALLAEVRAYPSPPTRVEVEAEEGAQRYATPLKIATDDGIVSFLGTTTVFGTPMDVTLSELALEMLFPADARTAAIVNALSSGERVAVPHGTVLVEAR